MVALLALAAGCGYGPPERHVWVSDYNTPNSGHATVAVREFGTSRYPTGIAAFPDGGVPKRLDEGVEVSICTADHPTFEVMAVIVEPIDPRRPGEIGTARVLEWGASTIRARLLSERETTLVLPPWARDRRASGDAGRRATVIPECVGALGQLRQSRRFPDGRLATE